MTAHAPSLVDADILFSDNAGYGNVVSETTSAGELERPELLFDRLAEIDWAFTVDDTRFLTHDIHPYPAKFIPQLPANLIANLSVRGDLVLDPFCGSGTTALEAVRLGRRAVGVDANRVGILAARVKTARLDVRSRRELQGIRSKLASQYESICKKPSSLAAREEFIPQIPNIEKWFESQAIVELSLIRAVVENQEVGAAKDVLQLALSRIILKVSNQDSETRYVSKPKPVAPGMVTKTYLGAFDTILRAIDTTESSIRYGVSEFHEADSRSIPETIIPAESVDLVVTSPPYGNAMDYHLYHRFRLFWLGADPRKLAKKEVGSHLRHQKEGSGFNEFRDELAMTIENMKNVLRKGRYAAIIIGDSVYSGKRYSGGDLVQSIGESTGWEHVGTLQRKLHRTKRSFAVAGRRANEESIVILRKPGRRTHSTLTMPPYQMWPYEVELRKREVAVVLGRKTIPTDPNSPIRLKLSPSESALARKLTFTHEVSFPTTSERTWQSVLENGHAADPAARKDPKYVTHGIHPYKGKFYPQLAKALINVSGIHAGSVILDPFCGSGTTALEGYLNGFRVYGCDLSPLAAKIATAKVGVLSQSPATVREANDALLAHVNDAPAKFKHCRDSFSSDCLEELESWFASPVLDKIDWVLHRIRSVSSGVLQDYFEVILSSIIREVSQQEPRDLRIRRRKEPIDDADVLGLYGTAVARQFARLEKFWSVRGYAPAALCPASITQGDSRTDKPFSNLGLADESVDFVLTSPPYATALPYIDTDRLSLLAIQGLQAAQRRPLEEDLVGSREISKKIRLDFENRLVSDELNMPDSATVFIRNLLRKGKREDLGFRRQAVPALLSRFFCDMTSVFTQVERLLKPGGKVAVVMGSNTTTIGDEVIAIPTIDLTADVCRHVGLRVQEELPISVTTENNVHIRNAIKENVVIICSKPG